MYVSKKSADEKKHVRDFVAFAFDPGQSESLVAEAGYVPLPAAAYASARAKFDARKVGTFFGGTSRIGVTIDELLADAQ